MAPNAPRPAGVTDDPIEIVPADSAWVGEFRRIARALRTALGPTARRIDHIGSTAVAGLDAKPVIDIQVSMDDVRNAAAYRPPLEAIGYVFHSANPDRSKRFFREPPTERRRTHVHLRSVGSFDEQLNLLFRDYLRAHPDEAREYARTKWTLAEAHRWDRDGYVRSKAPAVWAILLRAHDWMQEIGWAPGPSDA